jgi:uncharacterized membrane protein
MLESMTVREKVNAIYIAYLASFVIAPLSFVAVFFTYKIRQAARDTWLESHCNWLIQTFWVSFAVFVVGMFTTTLYIGYMLMLLAGLWFFYRTIKGWIRLSENQTTEPKGFGLT